jgi:sugar lactone lactonase YvrE
VYVDSNNAIYVADFNNNRIQQWLPNAVTGTTVAGQTGICGSGGGLLCNPSRIYGDSQQTLYIADTNGIYLWPSGSSVGTLINGSSTVGSFYGIFVDNNRNVYASVSSGYSVIMWTPTTSTITTVAGGNGAGYTLSNLYVPYGLTVDSSTDIIYVSNTNLHTIVAWKSGATNGTIVAGRNGTTGGGSYLLRNPRDVKRDSNGNLYVVDTGNNRALLFCQNPPNETAITIVDTNLNAPQSIALDSNLNVYIADYNNHRIQKFNRIV